MDFDEKYEDIVKEINSMQGIDKETKQSTLKDILFNLSLINETLSKIEINPPMNDVDKDALQYVHKQIVNIDLDKLKDCLSILKTQKYCIFFTSLKYFGTEACIDYPFTNLHNNIFSLIRLRKIVGPISPSALTKKNKLEHNPNQELKKGYEYYSRITNPETYQYVLVVTKQLELIFLGDYEKNVQTNDVDNLINQARRKKYYPFNQISKVLNIGESISSNYVLLEKYLDIDRISDWKEKEKKNKMVFFLTNISAECNNKNRIKIIRLPDKIAFSNPIVLAGKDASEIIKYPSSKNNLNYQFQNICVSIKGLGVVFIGNKRGLFNMNIDQIYEYCYESIFYLDFYLSNYFSLKDISKSNIDLDKLYVYKIFEYGLFETFAKPEVENKFKEAIVRAIKDADKNFEEKLKSYIAEISS